MKLCFRYFFTLLVIVILNACGDVPSTSSHASKIYAVNYSRRLDVALGVYSQVSITVKDNSLKAALTASESDKYSIEPINDTLDHFEIDKICEDVTVNETCTFKISPKESYDKGNTTFDFKVVFADKTSELFHIDTKLIKLKYSDSPQINLPEFSTRTISVVNTSTNNPVYFDEKPDFIPNHGSDEITIKNNTCNTILNPGKACAFEVYSDKPASGEIALDDNLPAPFSIEFSEVAVVGEVLQDLPEDTAIGKNYTFTYRFVNTNKQSYANEIQFQNSLSEGAVIDLTQSSCSGLTTLAPAENCTWVGTFIPKSTGKNSISIALSYLQGGAVRLESSTYATKVAVSGKKITAIDTNIAQGVSYPFAYEFTNTSDKFSATGIGFASTDDIEGLNVDANSSTCLSAKTLAPKQSCIWQGIFTPQKEMKAQPISATLSYNEGDSVTLTDSTTVTNVVVKGERVKYFGTNIIRERTYTFEYKFTNENEKLPATDIHFDKTFPQSSGFSLDTDSTCENITTLSPKASCSFKGSFTPTESDKLAKIIVTLSYKEGQGITLTSEANVVSAAVSAKAEPNIPENVLKGHKYDFIYTFTNTGETPATNLMFQNFFPTEQGFKINQAQSSCQDKEKLALGESCTWQGSLTPQTITGQVTMSSTLSYTEGDKVMLASSATITEVSVEGSAVEDHQLPVNTAVKNTYTFSYKFSNKSQYDATGVVFDHVFSEDEGFALDKNSSDCLSLANDTLQAGTACVIVGVFSPIKKTSNASIKVSMKYKEGMPVTLISNTRVEEVVVEPDKAIAKPIPENVAKSVSHIFQYGFKNSSPNLPATDITFTKPSNFDVTIDTQKSTCMKAGTELTELGPLQSCIWAGTFKSETLGEQNVEFTLSYKEGRKVTIGNIVNVSGLAIEGIVNSDIPKETNKDEEYNFSYQFNNTNQLFPATGVNLRSVYSNDVNITENTCQGLTELAAGNACNIKGIFKPSTLGAQLISFTFSYNEGDDVALAAMPLIKGKTSPISPFADRTIFPDHAWPNPRFVEAKSQDASPCPEALQDELTGLMWVKDGSQASTSWVKSKNYAENLNLCGYTDWRLPTINEIKSLLEYSSTTIGGWLNQHGFTNIKQTYPYAYYWASNKNITDNKYYYIDTASDGNIGIMPSDGKALPVRTTNKASNAVIPDTEPGGSGSGKWPDPRFAMITGKDGKLCADALEDKLTGLVWLKNAGVYTFSFPRAKEVVKNLNICGYTDWRLPNITELTSLINFSKASSEWLQESGFENIAEQFWSSSTRAKYPDYQWIVDFRINQITSSDGYCKALAVRYGSSADYKKE